MVAGVETVQLQVFLGASAPQAQGIDAGTPPADDRRVVGDRPDPLVRPPDGSATVLAVDLHAAAEVDVVADLGSFELPGIAEIQPGLGLLLLPAVGQHLAEQAMLVADAIAMRGNVEAGHAFHEACRQASEAAVAERRVRLQGNDPLQVDAQLGKGLAGFLEQPEVAEVVQQQATDEELQGQVVDPLARGRFTLRGGLLPVVDDVVAHRQGHRFEPVVRARGGWVAADAVAQFGEDAGFQGLDRTWGLVLAVGHRRASFRPAAAGRCLRGFLRRSCVPARRPPRFPGAGGRAGRGRPGSGGGPPIAPGRSRNAGRCRRAVAPG